MSICDWLARRHAAPPPDWLSNLDPAAAVPADPAGSRPAARRLVSAFLGSRTVYYPGSHIDGDPVALFNRSRSAACFVYVDYILGRDALEQEIQRNGFRGYRSLLAIDLLPEDFSPWRPTIAPPERAAGLRPESPYAKLCVFERLPGRPETLGQSRFAILFLCADGHAAYDALYCQDNGTPAPFCFVAEDHGFGGDYSTWGPDGVACQIAEASGVLPDLMLVARETRPWPGYRRVPASGEPQGYWRNTRWLWERA